MENVALSIKEFVMNALGVNPLEMIIQIASTLLLFLVVRFFFWNNITEYLEKRKSTMNHEYDEAKKATLEAEKLKTDADLEYTNIRNSAKGMFEQAKERGEAERKEIVLKAKKEASVLVENAHVEIISEIEKAKLSINDEIVSVATLMAEKIIDRELDEKKHKDLIKQVTAEVSN